MADELIKAKNKRRGLKTAITKILKVIESELEETEVNIDLLEENLELLEDKSITLKELDIEIETHLNPEEVESEIISIEEYSEKILRWRHRAKKHIQKFQLNTENITRENSIVSSHTNENNPKETRNNIKLPKMIMPKFYGDISQWLSFWNSFEISVHNNESLEKIEKFIYLKSQLGGTALNTIEGFALSPENYDSAIQLLEERFGNKDILINTHIDNLLKIPPLRDSNDIKTFRKIFEQLQNQIRSLTALNVTSDTYGSLLCPIIIKLLPIDLILEYNKQRKGKSNYDLSNLIQFISEELYARERTFISKSDSSRKQNETSHGRQPQYSRQNELVSEKKKYYASTAADLLTTTKNKETKIICGFCEDTHETFQCKTAANWSMNEKIEKLKRKGICFKCLQASKHLARFCKEKINKCKCGRSHYSIMCTDNNNDNENVYPPKDYALTNKESIPFILLQTLVVTLKGVNTEKHVRVLLDSGSQRSYISSFAANALNYRGIGSEEIIHGLFGGIEKKEMHTKYMLQMSSLQGNFQCSFEVLNQKKICTHVPQIPYGKYLSKLKENGIYLTDMKNKSVKILCENSPLEIHVLIGADMLGTLLTGKIKQLSDGLSCVHTKLGWTLMGKTKEHEQANSTQTALSLHVNDVKISDLWSLDCLGIKEPATTQTKKEIDQATEEYFLRSLKKDNEGRYQVSLPWLDSHSDLPDNMSIAEKRLGSCVRNLKTKNYLKEYQNVFREWLEEEIIEQVEKSETLKCHYLPHRAVFRENTTTNIRPVFDASAKAKNSKSLNDCIEKGPNFLELIPAIINRFRVGTYGVIADIRRAFLQISVDPQDRDFLRFLWWEDGDPAKLKIFRHRRVVFGVNASPFLLSATINFHLDNVPEHLQTVAKKLKASMYVDNCVASVDTVEQLNQFIEESKEIMFAGKFDLRGWKYNKPENEISIFDDSDENYNEDVSVLGLKWNLLSDTLSCDLKDEFQTETMTKRNILSLVHRIFDPIGFTSPVTLIPKQMLQDCWKMKVTWDEILPECLMKKFIEWTKQLKCLREIKIPRRLPELNKDTSMHIFCDASKTAYATCIFLRASYGNSVKTQLVQARSKVAPIKAVSIPRLELLACTIGARLARTVKDDLKLENIATYYWSDSSNALHWIKKEENWATFVYNRVHEIRNLSNPENWNFVPGKLNPADLPSRGCTAAYLKRSLWWEGPDWLKQPQGLWPKIQIYPDIEIVNSEKKKIVINSTNIPIDTFELYEKCSSYSKMVRITAWLYRFYKNAKSKTNDRNLEITLSLEEINNAECIVLKYAQTKGFTNELKKHSTLQTISDEKGLIKVQTKISMRDDLDTFRYPIVLPSNHNITFRLIFEKHTEENHAGVQTLMSILRECYWILKGRKTIRKVIRTCLTCKRFSASPIEVISAPLPEDRVRDALVFEVIGTDLCGPLYLKNGIKAWVVLFTCAVYRAIHIEVVTSLSTDSFIQAFRRHIARRGRPKTVYSDNGTNFSGTAKELRAVDWKKLKEFATMKKIEWKFIPPAAPWWGGFWERLIGMLKTVLRKVLGRTSLEYEELYTVLCDTENLINSRPLTYMSEDHEDLTAITPAMFLRELEESGVPDIDFIDTTKMQKRIIYRKRIRDDLRKRFRLEYLGQLRNFTKVKKESNIKEGDIVLVGDDDKKRINWPLARIQQIFPGKDGKIRVVRVKTQSGSYLRPVQKIFNLELQDRNSVLVPKIKDPEVFTRSGREIRKPQRLGL